MVIHGGAVENNSTIRAQYCVVGSGMGGSAVASTLARAGKDVLLIEAGSAQPSASNFSNVTAEHTGRPFGIPLTRCIELGGTSNAWHGNSNPLDEQDFEPRPWLSGDGWPLRRQDLNPFYEKAALLLGHDSCGGLEPDRLPPSVRRSIEKIRFDSSVLQPKFLEYQKPPHRWKGTLLDLANSGKLRCLLNTCAGTAA